MDSSDIDNSESVVNENLFVPQPRMGATLAVKNGVLYLYGGTNKFSFTTDSELSISEESMFCETEL
jgi:hypothetical protein